MNEKLKNKFLALYCMVLADGVIDAREMETLYKIGKEDYNISSDEINEAIRDSGIFSVSLDSLEEKISLLYQMAEIAIADDNIHNAERTIMRKYAKKMGFMDENIDSIVDYLFQQASSGISLEEILKRVESMSK